MAVVLKVGFFLTVKRNFFNEKKLSKIYKI
jgi:hypothetical protein